MQRSLSHTSAPLTHTRPAKAEFDSMWRRSALLSRAAGLRLDAERREVEEQIAERQQRQHAEAQKPHSQSLVCLADLRKQLREPAADHSAKRFDGFGEARPAETNWSPAPQLRVSRLVARKSGAGRLTAFSGGSVARTCSSRIVADFETLGRLSFNDARTTSSRYIAPHALLSFD